MSDLLCRLASILSEKIKMLRQSENETAEFEGWM